MPSAMFDYLDSDDDKMKYDLDQAYLERSSSSWLAILKRDIGAPDNAVNVANGMLTAAGYSIRFGSKLYRYSKTLPKYSIRGDATTLNMGGNFKIVKRLNPESGYKVGKKHGISMNSNTIKEFSKKKSVRSMGK